MTSQWLSEIATCFWPRGFSRDIWMVADAARDPRIFTMLRELHLEYYCLYSGPLTPALELAAPYLVQLDYDDQGSRHFLRSAWGNNWGVFLKCTSHANKLRRHLREFLVVLDSWGNRLVFRYYDPRVLRVYLPTCTPDELSTFFGPIENFWMEDKTPDVILNYSFDLNGLSERTQRFRWPDS
jgi:hypothetical protein